MKTLVKTSLKLLFRTKVFWFFLVITPILSTIILKNKFDSSAAYTDKSNEDIIELDDSADKVAYFGGQGEYMVKVYDAAGSEYSEYFLNKLSHCGLFRVCRVKLDGPATDAFLKERNRADGFEDRMGAALYLSPEFDRAIKEGRLHEALTVFILSEDERNAILENEIGEQLLRLGTLDSLEHADDMLPKKTVISLAGKDERSLSEQQINQKTQIGYAFAFMTLGFVFCGIFVAHVSIKEQKNGVYTRIALTGTGTLKYFASKFVVTLCVAVMNTFVMAICSLFLNMDDLGMSRVQFLLMIFLLGVIFSSLSMLLGILLGDVMSANVAAFSVWCMSALFSGLYFPLKDTSAGIRFISSLMPQKWFLEGTEMIFVRDNRVYFMLLCITVAYMLVILSLGGLGLKMRRTDEWGDS